jgi:hypothetical protein
VRRLAVGSITDTHLASLRQQPASWRPWLQQTSTPERQPDRYGDTVPAATTGERSVLVRQGRGDDGLNRAPDTAARRYLRRLYEELGSKNQVLQQAWGGVVNDSGKTPKTKRWLDEALTEVMT